MWHGKEYHYETDFLGEELASSGSDPGCNEHTALFMNPAIDVLSFLFLWAEREMERERLID